MRPVAVMLVVLTAWLWVSPVVGDSPDPCPMAATETAGPCWQSPCPCDHGTTATVVARVTFTLPVAAASSAPGATLRLCRVGAQPPLTSGFPQPIDHPPSPRA